jgi:hypothetical protein
MIDGHPALIEIKARLGQNLPVSARTASRPQCRPTG